MNEIDNPDSEWVGVDKVQKMMLFNNIKDTTIIDWINLASLKINKDYIIVDNIFYFHLSAAIRIILVYGVEILDEDIGIVTYYENGQVLQKRVSGVPGMPPVEIKPGLK
jgi:hypothetical protein